MKKIVMALTVVAMASIVNAASFTWGFASEDYTDHNGDALTTGSVFLYLGTVTASDTAFNTSAGTLLATDGFNDEYNVYGNVNDSALTSNDALISIAEGQAYTLILTETAASTLDGYSGYYILVTGESADGVIAGTTPVHYADFTNWDSAQTSSIMSIPEPTSGLLLILGMAGLALRRKHA